MDTHPTQPVDEHPLAADEVGNLLLSIPKATQRLGLGRSYGYLMARHGYLRTIPVGTRRLVPVAAVEETARLLIAGRVPNVKQLRAMKANWTPADTACSTQQQQP